MSKLVLARDRKRAGHDSTWQGYRQPGGALAKIDIPLATIAGLELVHRDRADLAPVVQLEDLSPVDPVDPDHLEHGKSLVLAGH